MSIVQAKEPSSSLRLIKQKVKRGQNGSTDSLPQNQDLVRDEGNSQTGPYEVLSPQPPAFPRREDSRSPIRHVDASSAVSGKCLPEVSHNITPGQKKNNTLSNESYHITTLTTPPGSTGKKSEIGSANSKYSTIANCASPKADGPALDMTQYEVGLDNLGNTCFMNSVLQCLLHIEPLVTFFLQPNIEHQLNLASPKKGALAMAFRQLVHEVYRKRSSNSVSPVNIQKAVCVHAPYLMDFQQQDSQEFLRFLLDGMSEDLCRKHSEQETLTSPPGSHNLHGKADAKSLSSPTILPMLPYSTNNSPTTVNANSSSGVMDFSRTAPAGSAEFGQQQKLQQQQQEHSGRSTGGAASQRLRDETQRMRLSSESSNSETAIKATGSRSVGDVALSASSSTTSTLFPKLKNNNQGEEETSTGRLGSNSKYVSRLRQRSEQGFGDQSDRLSPLPTSTPSSSSSAVMPFSPGGVAAAVVHSSSEKARVDAVLRSADMGEDCSFEDPEGEARSKSENFGEPQQVKQAEIYDSPSGRRLRRVSRPRREENNGNVTGDGSMEADLSASFSQRLALSGVDPQLWTRILNAEKEARVAWGKYLKLNDSVITDIFAGQLQSTIECSTCHHRSSSYDPFLDLSVPIYRESDGQQPLRSFLGSIRSSIGGGGGVGGGAGRASSAGGDANKSTLEKCLEKFTAAETLEGDNMYLCEKCKTKRKSVKQLSIYKYPQVLVIHIKRFKYSSTRREKLSTDVHFPLAGLDLSPYVSPDLPPPAPPAAGVSVSHSNAQDSTALAISTHTPHMQQHHDPDQSAARPPPLYDLIGVSNHHGSLNSGHYIAHVDTTGGGRAEKSRWMCFNDSRVSAAQAGSIAGPTAYVLFYRLQQS